LSHVSSPCIYYDGIFRMALYMAVYGLFVKFL
jgi:hypothetical protein